jgi:hypothetical protein
MDAIYQVISLVVVVPSDLKVHWESMTLDKHGKDRVTIQHVDIVVGSCHTEEGVANPEILNAHCFKYDTATSLVALVHFLPSKWTLLPFQCM